MDIVYACLARRAAANTEPAGEMAEVLGALWAHATPEDGLEHASASHQLDRVDLLLFLLSQRSSEAGHGSGVERAAGLLRRCHEASPMMRDRYLPPQVPDRPAV